ncbi:serine/threonine protein kinase, partial [Streptomyces atratus]|nr:serine/threonine protein kinase [Streptomyces atratus]
PDRPAARPQPPSPPPGRPAPAAARPDVAAAVDDVKKLLGEGRITQAVDILGSILPVAAEQHGEDSAVVRILRKQYAATLMDDGQYRRALPELRRLADDRAAEAGPADPQTLQFRHDAAQCLEQLGEPAAALAGYRELLPYFENHRATGGDPARSFEIRNRIAHLLLALGDHVTARVQLQALLYDAERAYGPHHPLPVELRRRLDRQVEVGGG